MSVIEVDGLVVRYGDVTVHDGITFDVKENEIFSILGGSGSGKTTLLNVLIFLCRPTSGRVSMLQSNVWELSESGRARFMKNIGVVFQFGALFSSLNVIQNVCIMLDEYSNYPKHLYHDVARFWIHTVGLDMSVCTKMPDELSGGMKKRVALARALSVEPKFLFLDEPTSGLDLASAGRFDELISKLRDEFGVTVVMITHDLDSVRDITDRFVLLGHGKVLFCGTLCEMKKEFYNGLHADTLFSSSRGRRYL